MTPFTKKVYDALRTIPRGRVLTYKDVARRIGSPRAYRAVGNALNKNPFAPQVPCHRVVASNGSLGGYAGGLKMKIKLLKQEGVPIQKNRVDLKKYRA